MKKFEINDQNYQQISRYISDCFSDYERTNKLLDLMSFGIHDSIDHKNDAVNEFNNLCSNSEPDKLNSWCQKWMTKKSWVAMLSHLRMTKHRKKLKTLLITPETYNSLKKFKAKSKSKSLDKAIVKLLSSAKEL